MIKKIIKRALRVLIARLGPGRLNFSFKKRLVILTYHRILPSNHADINYEQAGMYVCPETFKMHMQVLKKNYAIMHLSEWIHKNKNNETLPDITFAITFDDGWKDNYEYAFPVLRELGIPATVFLVSDYLGSQYRFWPNRLSYLLKNINIGTSLNLTEYSWLKLLNLTFKIDDISLLDSTQIDEIIEQCKDKPDSTILTYLEAMENISSLAYADSGTNILSHAELKEMISGGVFQIGSHTCRHMRLLDTLSETQMENEIIHSKLMLEEISGQQVELFCYPNGDFTNAAVSCVRGNYTSAVTTEFGWNDSASDPYLLRRIGLHEDISNDEIAFVARISGLR